MSQKLYIQVAEKHLQAAQGKQWDYPKESVELKGREATLQALREGKTVEEVYLQCIARFGTITGAVMNSMFGHSSKATTAAVRKGMKILIGSN